MNEAYEAKTEGARRTWNPEELQELLRDKINQKTAGANNRVLSAIRLFDREAGVITAESWCRTLPRLVQVKLSREESLDLFDAYTGEKEALSTETFVEKVLPPDFAKRRETLAASKEPVPTP